MYVFAKILADNNCPIKFIEDRGENFPHSQPVWDDVEVFFDSGFDYKGIDWQQFESSHGWAPPSWYQRPKQIVGGEQVIGKLSSEPLVVKYLACRYLRASKEALSVFSSMVECDFLIVCGIKASIIAMLTGKPYMVFPHGSDMRVAIGAERKGGGVKGLLVGWLVARSFRSAAFVGSSLPDASAEVAQEKYLRLKDLPVSRLPLPYKARKRLPDKERRKKLFELLSGFNIQLPDSRYYCFSPSRISFHWKGHDRLLRAIKNNKSTLEIHFIFLGWGDDYLEAMEYVRANELSEHVTILPLFLSKKYLFRFFESVDFIIDELNGSGSYGTSLSEAMSLGCPVVTWISDIFDRPDWQRPPVIQAQTEEQLGDAMVKISHGDIDLDAQSNLVCEWFSQVHESAAVLRVLDEKIATASLR